MESYIEAAIIETLCDISVIPEAIVKNWSSGYRINFSSLWDIWDDALKIVNPKVLINAIKTIDRDKVENNFWNYEEDMDMAGEFDSMTAEEMVDEFDSTFERVKAKMINELKKI